MTLIEVLIALSILALVSVLIWTGFSETARNKARVEASLDRDHVIRLTLERMSRELSMAFVSAQKNPDLSLQAVVTAFVGTDSLAGSRLDFTSFSHQRLYRNAHESDQNEISYFVARDGARKGELVLARREQNRIDEDPRSGGRVDVLLRGVESFKLSYLDPLTGTWLNTWDTTQAAMQPNRLPKQVRIRLTLKETGATRRTRTFGARATLPMVYALNHATYTP